MAEETLSELRARLREKYRTPLTYAEKVMDQQVDRGLFSPERAFVIEAPERNSVLITAPARTVTSEQAGLLAGKNPGFGYLSGRFVEADRPNRNSAFWSSEDLELGQHTVAGGPLNWLHEERNIIGTLLTASFQKTQPKQTAAYVGSVSNSANSSAITFPTQQAADEVGNHIKADAAVWKYLFGVEYATLEMASRDKQLFYSMECISKTVECLDTPGRPGCGGVFEYAQFCTDKASVCQHLREGSSVRRFADPIFLGGAVIVPPIRPGWAGAEASVVKAAAEITEKADIQGLAHKDAEGMVQQLLLWANSK